MPLTKRDVDSLTFNPAGPAVQILRSPGEPPGFGVRVFSSGVKSFVLDYRTQQGRARRMTIGKYGALTLQEGRELARRALLSTKTGADPAEERKEARRGESVKELSELYIERHAKKHKKTWREDERRLNKHVIPALGSRKIRDVARADIAKLHGRIGDTAPYEANRILALLAVMFSKAQEWGLLDEGVPNPAARVQPFKERSRDRWVMPEELPELWKAIEAEPNLYRRAAFKLYLFTGLRRNELLKIRWKDVDLTRAEIRLPDTKAGRSHTVALSQPALEILQQLPRQIGNAHVFPGRVAGEPLVNVAKSWRRIRKQAGLEDVRLHDLRRTVGAMMATSGTSVGVVGKVLNHTTPSATAVYARIAEPAARKALEEHGARVAALTQVTG